MGCALVYNMPKTGNVCPFSKQTNAETSDLYTISQTLSLESAWRLQWRTEDGTAAEVGLGLLSLSRSQQPLGSWVDT
jgi:hypothetical protein